METFAVEGSGRECERYPHQTMDGQPFSSLVHQSHGRHQISDPDLVHIRNSGHGVTVLSAEYLPGSLNVGADRESRTVHSSGKWMLNHGMFEALN